MYLGKDQYIFGLNMLYRMNILNWLHIRDGIQGDFQYKMVNKNKLPDYWVLYIESLDHRVMVDMDWHILVRQLFGEMNGL